MGFGWERNAAGFREGRSAFREVSLFDVSRQRVKTAGEVTLPEDSPQGRLSSKQFRRLERASKMLLLAAGEAWAQARWAGGEDLALVLGTTSGGMSLGQDYYRQALATPQGNRGQPSRVTHYLAQRQALDVQTALGFTGPVWTIANACAAGGNAIGHAFEMVRDGKRARAVAGGYDALSHLVFSGFDSLQALSPTTCRPFDRDRDGLALGEGAAVLCLETAEAALERGATILGEIVGYGAATDCHHLTQPHPEGDAALTSMAEACRSAGLTPDRIDYINAHGTGTVLNDGAEAEAINRWAGEWAVTIPVSSTKSAVGHLLGAAGAVEAVVCLMALGGQWLPPTATLAHPDPRARFPIVAKPTDFSDFRPGRAMERALSNSFGFGGANASLIFRRWS